MNEIIDYGPYVSKMASFISAGKLEEAKLIAKSMPKRIKQAKIQNAKYVLNEQENKGKYSLQDVMKVLIRDGFIDRYTGLRLVIPPALRIMSEIIPYEFPYDPHWKTGFCHDSYWDISATVDHVNCLANNGINNIENLVSTSMSKNIQKNSIPLDFLKWTLRQTGDLSEWDGLSKFYIEQCSIKTELLKKKYFRDWYKAVQIFFG